MSLKTVNKTMKVPSGAERRVVLALCVALGVVAFSAASALAAGGPHILSGSFGGEGSGAGQLKEPSGVAVNEAKGYVYVVDKGNNRVERFSSTGTYELQFTGSGEAPAPLSAPEGIAVDNDPLSPSFEDVYAVDSPQHVVDKFEADGTYLGQIAAGEGGAPLEPLDGVAVDPKGMVWVDQENREIDDFSDTQPNAFVSSVHSPFGVEPGFAVDSENNLYLRRGYGYFGKANSSGQELNEDVGCEEKHAELIGCEEDASAAAVDFVNNDVYIDDISTVAIVSPGGSLVERFGSGSLSAGTGIAVNPTASAGFPEGVVYVADTASDTVQLYTSKQPGAPTVSAESESASEVTATSATLNGAVNPEGAQTSYYFRYGATSCKSNPGACGDQPAAPGPAIGDGYSSVTVPSVSLQGLSAGTIYHYQLVAVNSHETVYGTEQTFTTQIPGEGFMLPDDRGFEMVSPVEKSGGDVVGIEGVSAGGIVQAAASGDAITYLTEASTATHVGETEHQPESAPFASQYLSTRGSDGWTTQPINTPTSSQSYALVGQGSAYEEFSTELESGLEPSFNASNVPGQGSEIPVLSAEAPLGYENIYVRNNATGAAQPLMTNANSTRTVPAGNFNIAFSGATPNLAHIVFHSSAALLPDATENTAEEANLYEWTAGQLQLVNILPGATVGTPGAAGELSGPRAISENGSRVVFTEGQALYVRDGIGTSGAQTVQVDAAQGGPEGGAGVFVTASSDGSRVFFTDARRLKADSTAGKGEVLGDLYEFDVETGTLTDLTVDSHGDADVVGVLGASEDGSYVYFVANGLLTEGAASGDCTKNEPEHASATCNLYMEHNGVTSFIAELSGEDDRLAGSNFSLPVGLVADDWATRLGGRSVRVAGDGEQLVFMSTRSLTGYDNRGSECFPVEKGENTKDEYSPGMCAEVYLYDASSGVVRCVSCNPDGATPLGPSGIPGATQDGEALSLYDSRILSVGGGRVFFDSADALVPQATNHRINVYEWELDGVGSCQSAADEGGCVFLISGGKSSEDSAFVDASENGEDVFFTTDAQLVPEDKDQLVDLYDARVGGGVPASITASTCSGTGCQGLPAATPVFARPASVTFAGTGNFPAHAAKAAVKPKALTRPQKLAKELKACAKDKRKAKRTSCERAARARYGAKSRSKAKKSARGGR